MNKIISALIFISGLPVAGHALSNDRRVISYEAEGLVYYRLEGFTPNATVAFYSDVSGGTCLRTVTTDGTGQLQLQTGPEFKPSFVLNTVTAQGNPGDGMVTFIGEKAFRIDNIAAKQRNNSIVLSWDAAVSPAGDYVFTILRSTDKITYTPLTVVPANSAALSAYSYADQQEQVGTVYYKIRVSSVKSGISYTSEALTSGVHSLKLYPTVAEDHIQVVYDENLIQARYTIVDLQGKIVGKGIISASAATITVKTLAAGSYLLHLEGPDGKPVKPARFVKK